MVFLMPKLLHRAYKCFIHLVGCPTQWRRSENEEGSGDGLLLIDTDLYIYIYILSFEHLSMDTNIFKVSILIALFLEQ